MTLRHTIYTGLAGVHLILVACGAAGLSPLPRDDAAGHALQVVRDYTGSSAGYGFFAPGVSSTLRPRFKLIDAEGKQWTDCFDADISREAELRVGSGVGLVGAFPELTPFFTQSWAAAMLGRHPTAKTVIISIEAYDVPPMSEYQNGERAQWQVVFPPPDEPELGIFHRK
jgi:hypothetical protein